MASRGIDFLLEPTPNPAEVTFKVKQDANQFKLVNLPVFGQTYKSSNLGTMPRVSEFGDFVYINMTVEGDALWLHYGAHKTQAQRDTPFNTVYSTRYYPWAPVLMTLRLVMTTAFPQTVNSGPNTISAARYFPRYSYRPTPSINSVIKIEQYLAPSAWSGQSVVHPQPIPEEVSGSYLGASISFPKCLHSLIVLDETVPGAVFVEGQGTITVPRTTSSTGQTFPATNFQDWAPFILEDQVQSTESGLYLREKVTVYPPFRPAPIQN